MEKFITYLQYKDLSSATIDRYTRQVTSLEAWYSSELENCQKKDVLNYLAYREYSEKCVIQDTD